MSVWRSRAQSRYRPRAVSPSHMPPATWVYNSHHHLSSFGPLGTRALSFLPPKLPEARADQREKRHFLLIRTIKKHLSRDLGGSDACILWGLQERVSLWACAGEPGGRGQVDGDSESWHCPCSKYGCARARHPTGCGPGRGTLENKANSLKECGICYFFFKHLYQGIIDIYCIYGTFLKCTV